ncbi:MAG: methylenetetrahydrofolate reductase [NAD(P)H] [Myxococcota bacterium]
MRIPELYEAGAPVFSFEFFPPKGENGIRALLQTLDELRRLGPDFVSVTYPLDRSRRHLTVEIVCRIRRELGLEAMAHLTCVDATREELTTVLETLASQGLENILALRGDPPEASQSSVPREEWLPHAADLVAFVRKRFAFAVGGAAHPEKHPEAPDLETDLLHLKRKVEAGCEFLITQLFFCNKDYFALVERARAIGIEVPIVPGIMPVTSFRGIQRMAAMNGSRIPPELLEPLERVQDEPRAVEDIGVEYARRQCRELLAGGAPGIHFYTLNRSPATRRVLQHLRENAGRA